MWNKEKVAKLELEFHTQLNENLLFLERYEDVVVKSMDIIINNNTVPKYKISPNTQKAIYNAIKEETEVLLIKIAVIKAGENATMKDILQHYASNYCRIYAQRSSRETLGVSGCANCLHASECRYLINDNNEYLLKADQELAQEFCSRQNHCNNCDKNSVCAYTHSGPMFVYKDAYAESICKSRWKRYITQINSICSLPVTEPNPELGL